MIRKEYLINGEPFELVQDFQDNDFMRAEFNALTQRVFGFDFEAWYQAGYWKTRYRPFALMQNEKFVANVSVNILDFIIHGEEKKIVQIGTVMTDPAFRGKGLSRFLMEKALAAYENQSDFQYLFGGDEVKTFYPKFGFQEAKEYQCSKRVTRQAVRPDARKMNLDDPADLSLLTELMRKSIPVSQLAMRDNLELNMFYCGFFMKDSIFYLPNMNLAVVASEKAGELMVYDVFADHEFDLDQVIQGLMTEQEMTVLLGFSPLDQSGYEITAYKEEDRTLFIRGGQIGRAMFPLLAQA